jgi:hypothetical protein
MYLKEINFDHNKDHLTDILDMLICHAKDTDRELYDHVESLLYEMAYGKKISKEMAEEWVKNMKPKGQHWTHEETTQAMHELGYSLEPVEYYVVANMMYNDYYNLVKENEPLALELAEDWLDDEDSKDCKLYEYWKHVIKK